MFKKVCAVCRDLVHQETTPADMFSVHDLNDLFYRLAANEPTLTLQWCNVLILLGYDDEQFWTRVMMTDKKYIQSRSK